MDEADWPVGAHIKLVAEHRRLSSLEKMAYLFTLSISIFHHDTGSVRERYSLKP